MFDLSGKTALVTGAASGIGEAISHALSGNGAFVYVADLNEEAGRKVAEAIGGEFIKLDVSHDDDCVDAASHVHADRGNLDILVNNAGIGHVGNDPLLHFSEFIDVRIWWPVRVR